MGTKSSGWKFDKVQNIYMAQYLSTPYLIITKE